MASTNFVGFFRNPLRFDSTFNFHFRFYYLLPIKHFIESDCLLDQHRSHACKHNVEIYSGASVFVKSFLCVTDLNISLKIWAPKYQYGLVNLDKLEAHMAPGVLKLFATLFIVINAYVNSFKYDVLCDLWYESLVQHNLISCFQVNELQVSDRQYKELVAVAITLAEKLVNGKMNKQQYLDNEKSNKSKREELDSRMEALRSSLA